MRFKPILWLAAALAVGLVAFGVGRQLHSDPPPANAFDFDAVGYEAPPAIAGMTRGGFSGFGESAGLEGQTIISGRIVEVTPTRVTVQAVSGDRRSIDVSPGASVRRLEAASRGALRPGQTVVVRRQTGSDEGLAVLIVAEP